jgi:hypothetical protein
MKTIQMIDQINFEIEHNIDVEENEQKKAQLLETFKPLHFARTVSDVLYKLSSTTWFQFRFTETNNKWFKINPSDMDVLSTFSDKVKELVINSFGENMTFVNSLRKSRTMMGRIIPAMIKCKSQHEIVGKGSGRCIVTITLRKIGNYDFVNKCDKDLYVLNFLINKIKFDLPSE